LAKLRIGANCKVKFVGPGLCLCRLWIGKPVPDDAEHSDQTADQQHAEKNDHIFEHTDIRGILLSLGLRCKPRRCGFAELLHMKTPYRLAIVATETEAGERLDRILSQRFDDVSRARFQRLIAEGHVRVNGETIVEPRHRVKPGTEITASFPPAGDAVPEAEAIALDVVYEDSHLIVIDKPAGLVVHPSAGHQSGTLVNALIAHCGDSLSGIGGVRRPGIVHRLDKDTSGLLVVAKTDEAHQGLAKLFSTHGRDGSLERLYQAIVWGKPPRSRGVIEAPIDRASANRQKMAVVRSGRPAITHYKILRTFPQPGDPTLIECRLETGRTHQIRVHLSHLGHPVLGDPAYGKGFSASVKRLSQPAQQAIEILGRQALHAGVLGFQHPISGEFLRFESPLPLDIRVLIDALSET
jgi:23S rRNA pseudouridine1911/1915/1917 synthase